MVIWNGRDVLLYQREKRFIDTAVIPLLPIAFGDEMRQSASQGEFIQLFTTYLEKQFKGRMMLFPPLSYLAQEWKYDEFTLNEWSVHLREEGFEHLFFVTSDANWKQAEHHLNGTLIYIPGTSIEDMDDSFKYNFIENQVEQFLHNMFEIWAKPN